jgi:hypothetical protein
MNDGAAAAGVDKRIKSPLLQGFVETLSQPAGRREVDPPIQEDRFKAHPSSVSISTNQ